MNPGTRLGDPDESHAAQGSLHDLNGSQAAVLRLLTRCPGLTDEQLVREYQLRQGRTTIDNEPVYPEQAESGIRTRRHELELRGLVVEDGKTKGSTGRWMRKWAPATARPGVLFDESPRPPSSLGFD